MGTNGRVLIVVVCIVIGAIIGGNISSRDSEKKTAAIEMISQLAEETGSAKYAVGADIGRREIQSDKTTGYGIGGIIGGVVGAVAVSLIRKK